MPQRKRTAQAAADDQTAQQLAAQVRDYGFAVIDGQLGFMDVETGAGAQLSDVLFHTGQVGAQKLRIVIIREDEGAEPHLKVQRAAADLTRWHRRAAQGLQLTLGTK